MSPFEWILGDAGAPGVECELLCLPHAGGSSLSYREWPVWAPSWLGIRPVELPGRGRRFSQQPQRRMHALVSALTEVVQAREDRPYALFGHSMGALVAFELTRSLVASGGLPPRHLFLSAMAPPGRGAPCDGNLHTAPDEVLVDRLRTYNGTPKEVLENEELRGLVLPTIRADFEVLETYRPDFGEPLEVPITVFGGRDDPLVSPAELLGWRDFGPLAGIRVFEGDHFYLADQGEAVVSALSGALTSPVGAGQG